MPWFLRGDLRVLAMSSRVRRSQVMGERGPRQVACDSDVIRVGPRAACCRLIPQRGRGLRPATLVADHVYVTASQRNGTPSPRSLVVGSGRSVMSHSPVRRSVPGRTLGASDGDLWLTWVTAPAATARRGNSLPGVLQSSRCHPFGWHGPPGGATALEK